MINEYTPTNLLCMEYRKLREYLEDLEDPTVPDEGDLVGCA
jgi:hypothetical protein